MYMHSFFYTQTVDFVEGYDFKFVKNDGHMVWVERDWGGVSLDVL